MAWPCKSAAKPPNPNNELNTHEDQMSDHSIELLTARLWLLKLLLLLLL